MTISIPALRFGEEHHSLDRSPIVDLGTGEELASLGLALESQIAVDCLRHGKLRRAHEMLQSIPIRDRIAMSVLAADHFEGGTLECGGTSQSPADYLDVLCRTSGLSHRLGKQNTSRIVASLRDTEAVINGLSGGLPLDIFDTGIGEHGGAPVRLNPRVDAVGFAMPNNSPGVNVIPASCLAFGIPFLARPGSSEPFTLLRMIQAFIAAGFPKEVFGYYPCGYAAADRIPKLTEAAIVFGSDATLKKWKNHRLVHVHGTGYSKLIIGEDRIDDWESLIEEIALNVYMNSGRSCFAVSLILVPRYAKEIALAVAKRLAEIVPLPLDHPDALLSAMAMPNVAASVESMIVSGLAQGGAEDVTALFRNGERLMKFEGRTYLQPTLIACDSMDHPLARKEFLFPYSGIVQVSNSEAFANMGPTLSLGVYTKDEALKRRARRSKARLVSINSPTGKLDRRQPHEEDIMQLFYERQSCVEVA